MTLKEITNENLWNKFVVATGSHFLQSWGWGELQRQSGKTIWRLGLEDGGKLAAVALVIKNRLPLGKSYLYSPRGPLAVNQDYFNQITDELTKLGEQEKSIFIRIEPPAFVWALPRQYPTASIQPSQTLILNLAPSTEELLASFHQKTRYNINLAQKKGVTVRLGQDEADFASFWRLLQQTYSKQKIKTHPKDYYHRIVRATLGLPLQEFTAKLYLAEIDGRPIAANLLYYFGDVATYAHGGSDYNYRQLMAPHLLQWQQIQDAKNAGYKSYDFWGYDETKWPGVSRFKAGFLPAVALAKVGGGEIVKYPGTFDLPLDKFWYSVYKLGRRFH